MTMEHIGAPWKASDQLKIDRLPKEADLGAFIRAYLEARGLVMVPKEPTFEMAKAAIHLDPKSDLDAKYRAMLAAAPDPFGETQ